ncbi:MAG: DUF4232 domain-containing protein [Acidimicrobiales bacterium]
MPPIAPRPRGSIGYLAALVVVAVLVGPTAGASAAHSKSTTTTTIKTSIECNANQLTFSRPGAVSATSGEEAFTITITNVSARLCNIHGYPTVRFYTSAGRLLTFSYVHTSLYFKRQSPKLVRLVPGAHAYFIVAKYRCDLGEKYISSFFYLLAPYTTGEPFVEHVGGDQAGVMPYCDGSSRGPGQSLGISPVVATRAQLAP